MAEGQTGGQKIARLVKGDTTRTLMHTDVGNELVGAINKLLDMQVSPPGAGKFIRSEANMVLALTPDTLDLHVCIDGEDKIVSFVVQGAPRDP